LKKNGGVGAPEGMTEFVKARVERKGVSNSFSRVGGEKGKRSLPKKKVEKKIWGGKKKGKKGGFVRLRKKDSRSPYRAQKNAARVRPWQGRSDALWDRGWWVEGEKRT